MKLISLNDLREFLLSLPDDAPINMSHGVNDDCGCLMTQYGRSIGLEFEETVDASRARESYTWMQGYLTVAKIKEESSVFNLFLSWFSDTDGKANRNVAGFWKAQLK
jgi:hypothetical protein